MKTVHLLRHGHAEDGTPDRNRRLTSKGRNQIERLGHFFEATGIPKADRILHSPYTRAVESAKLIQPFLGQRDPIVEEFSSITPGDSIDSALQRILNSNETLLLVGHNPHLSFLTLELLDNCPVGFGFKKGAWRTLQQAAPDAPWEETAYWTPADVGA